MKEITKKIANLARLNLPEKDLKLYAAKFQAVLHYVEQLNELNTEDIQPMSHAAAEESCLREDVIIESTAVAEINSNAPELDGAFYQVPRVIIEEL